MTDVVLAREDALDQHFSDMDAVVTEYLKGLKNTEIARVTGMSASKVGVLLREWRELASSNEHIKSRGTQALNNADKHYDKLIQKAYAVMEDAEQAESLGQRLVAIKLVADMEAKRIDLLQRAGALEDSDISKQIVETERKQAILMEILKDTVGPCRHCRPIVQEKLAAITNDVVVIKAHDG